MIETSIESLDVRFQPIAQSWQEIMTGYVLPIRFKGFSVRRLETRRSLQRQATVLADHASTLKVGYHNFGLAMDFGIFDKIGVYVTDGTHPAYEAGCLVAEALGCVSGYRWKMKDSGHIEYHPDGVTLDKLKAAAGMLTT